MNPTGNQLPDFGIEPDADYIALVEARKAEVRVRHLAKRLAEPRSYYLTESKPSAIRRYAVRAVQGRTVFQAKE